MGRFLADHGWITWIIIGLIAGAIAKAIMPGRDPGGCLVTIVLGIGGAVLAGFLGQQLGWYQQGEGAGFIAAIVGALLANAIYQEAVLLKTGDEMRRPPFLAMRVIADGPGREYLRYACDRGATYALCQFRHLDLTNSQDMLWSDDRKKGIFNVTGYDTRLQMEK